ncbi:N-6 DNA methylase [Romboutsia sp. 1001216sp1]|uniref:HsdM family class I SAM-dependent methyltransferase n=1 Tax=Romboutsia sp. 1001216sp1 TaxID=2986997 RepID=UPI00232C6B34|nr:N-6 DNA methylase [Romboutsia sp. 1001216sp1]MDB8789187.1 N-6 DNA methylase [Romboutsia sp. 1001216sp1]
MGNERKTENIVRDELRRLGYYDDENIVIEEQKSDIPKIDKLLKNASKKGNNQGYPEFIITSKSNSEFLIVIECKANENKHKSNTLDKYADFAVDGSLLYGSYLSKEYDVLAIGVSGESKDKVKISHNVFLKESNEFNSYFDDHFMKFEDYYNGILKSNFKYNQDYSNLLSYTKRLNEKLHNKKVKESQRALLISGILIALKNKAFKDSYKKHETVRELISSLVTTISTQLERSQVSQEKKESLNLAFAFIQTNTALSDETTGKEFLEELIEEIDKEINGFMKTHEYVDTVSQFYIEFLRYANNDKGLGIVLTPTHITELFTKLANVDKNSIVLDNCCGTGGFLISSMKRMIQDANGDIEKEKKIKSEQLIGIEYQDDIYALLISNMILHEDGKTNIYLGDCFDKIKDVKSKFKPTVGLLNPPYKTKKSDIEELEFVLNNLEALEVGGCCIALIPISCVIEDKEVTRNLKQKILDKHTVEAVFSLPDALFHNSKVNVVTCAVMITAHKKHPSNKKTWFGYWRNDGFVKVKNKGRIDANHTWKDIEESWLEAFENREVIDGLSVMKKVTAEDEWCAEAYMEANYSNVTKEMYEETIKKFIMFNLLNKEEKEENEEND